MAGMVPGARLRSPSVISLFSQPRPPRCFYTIYR